jgi:hypothetical protein
MMLAQCCHLILTATALIIHLIACSSTPPAYEQILEAAQLRHPTQSLSDSLPNIDIFGTKYVLKIVHDIPADDEDDGVGVEWKWVREEGSARRDRVVILTEPSSTTDQQHQRPDRHNHSDFVIERPRAPNRPLHNLQLYYKELKSVLQALLPHDHRIAATSPLVKTMVRVSIEYVQQLVSQHPHQTIAHSAHPIHTHYPLTTHSLHLLSLFRQQRSKVWLDVREVCTLLGSGEGATESVEGCYGEWCRWLVAVAAFYGVTQSRFIEYHVGTQALVIKAHRQHLLYQ